jgi:hypothetical protein
VSTVPTTSSSQKSRAPWIAGTTIIVGVAILLVVLLTSGGKAASGADTTGKPEVVLSPAPTSSGYHNGQQVRLSVGPNKTFAPYARIVVLECADPNGQAANLPKSDMACDGNTVPGYSILVNKDGSFSTDHLQLFSLPNRTLGESSAQRPQCNQSHPCVLYVGQDQTNFTAPKVFSVPLTIAATGQKARAES